MSTRFPLACVALTAVVLAATASDQWSDHPVPVTAGPGLTTAAQPAVPAPMPAPAAPGCNRRASLRPQGPLPAPGQMPAGSTMARIAKRGQLIVGVIEDTYPISFRDASSRRLEGFDIDVARDIAGAILGDRERVLFRPLREADRFPTVESGQVDLAVVAATITCPLRERVDFSTVYYEAGQRVLVNRGSAITGLGNLGGKRVCAAGGTTSLQNVLDAPSTPIPVVPDIMADCLMLLQLGEVDAVSTDDTILAGMATQDLQTEVVGPRFTEEPYGVVMNKTTPDLVRFVNAVLARRVEDGRWQASYQRWLTPLGPPPAPPTPQYQD
ncbi:MAG: glutamate ABC transporter substrate-binding protein [Pseudonocardiaceae bacterium]